MKADEQRRARVRAGGHAESITYLAGGAGWRAECQCGASWDRPEYMHAWSAHAAHVERVAKGESR